MEFYQKKITQSQYRKSIQEDDTIVDIELNLPVLNKTDESLAYFRTKITDMTTIIAGIMLPKSLQGPEQITGCTDVILKKLGLG